MSNAPNGEFTIESLVARLNWRDDWPDFWVMLVEETSWCFTEDESDRLAGSPAWSSLSRDQQRHVEDHVARVLSAARRSLRIFTDGHPLKQRT